MELRQLRYFKAIVEAGSFTAAATTLRMSQPPLSMAIAKLETELGVALLLRSARGVRVTSAGAYLLDAASHMIDESDRIVAQLTRYGQGSAGSLTIASVPVLLWQRIPELLRAHAHQLPDIDIRLVDAAPWTAIDMVVTGSVDVAFVAIADRDRLTEQYRGTLHVLPWGTLSLTAVFGPDEADLPDPVPLSIFEDRVLAMPRRTLALPSLPDVVSDALAARHVRPREIRTVDNIPTILPLIEAGLASSVLPDVSDSLSHGRLVTRRIEDPLPPLSVAALVRSDVEPSPTLGRLLQRLRTAPDGNETSDG